jgi:hypothetical protein
MCGLSVENFMAEVKITREGIQHDAPLLEEGGGLKYKEVLLLEFQVKEAAKLLEMSGCACQRCAGRTGNLGKSRHLKEKEDC